MHLAFQTGLLKSGLSVIVIIFPFYINHRGWSEIDNVSPPWLASEVSAYSSYTMGPKILWSCISIIKKLKNYIVSCGAFKFLVIKDWYFHIVSVITLLLTIKRAETIRGNMVCKNFMKLWEFNYCYFKKGLRSHCDLCNVAFVQYVLYNHLSSEAAVRPHPKKGNIILII